MTESKTVKRLILADDLRGFRALQPPIHPSKIIEDKIADSVLHLCAQFNSLEILRYLLENQDCNCNQENADYKTPLHEAVLNGNFDVVKLLVANGAKIDALKKADWTPLMLAATKDNLEIIRFLVEQNADVSLRNKDGWTAFHVAVREGHLDVVRYFLAELNADNCQLKTISNNGRNPFHTAAFQGHLEVVRLMLNFCRDLEVVDAVDSCGVTPFLDAVQRDHVDICRLLLDFGADSNAVDRNGLNCLHLAAQASALDSIKYGVDKLGFDVDCKTSVCQFTPLHLAAKEDHLEAVRVLVRFEADVTQKDFKGRTPADLAIDAKKDQMGKLLNNCLAVSQIFKRS